MRAATFTHTGPAADVITIRDVPTPEPAAGEVRVKLATSGVNPSDVKRRGAAPAGKPAEYPLVIPHSDGAGTIDAVGPGVPESRIGERVWTINAQYRRAFGTAAEYCVVPNTFAPRLPDNTDFAVGACLGVPALTAYHAINLDGPMRGQMLLVQGGAGAVAFYAIQFAKLAGATVITTVSSDVKAERARSAGADHVVNYRTEDRKARIAEITGGKGVDRIIEVDLKANVMTYQDLLVDHGKAVIYGSGSGPIPIPSFIPNSTTLQFILVYTLTDAQRATYSAALNDLLTAGKLRHAVGAHFPLDRIAEAHEQVEAGSLGNVIVDVA
ncbi:MAG: NADPH:quinone reductase [Candidatus Lustribacter sp.]|jgi:NADPH2:quinone reductase